MYLTFSFQFNAVHRLWNPEFSEAQNVDVFGECANPAGHGHLYRVEVTVAGPVDEQRPVVMDRAAIRRLVDALVPRFHNANMDAVFEVDGFISTGENVVREMWKIIEPELHSGVRLHRVRVIETPKNSFTYYGDGA